MNRDVRELTSLAELAALVRARTGLHVRWAPEPDEPAGGSRDELTGVGLPGLSANSLDPEPWWGSQPLELWLARRLYDYHHLRHERPRTVMAWILAGTVVGRGPDNEPLLNGPELLGRLAERVLGEARELLRAEARDDTDWGPLRRPPELPR